MKQLVDKIRSLKTSIIKNKVNQKIKEFEGNKNLFNELCFCILTANFNAQRAIDIQNKIKNGFSTLSELKLAKKLKELGHRYPNIRAKYIVKARIYKDCLVNAIDSNNELKLREWLADNIKGIGYKEASHFLRNIGYKNSALIDFHIVDLLVKNKLIERPKTLTKLKYLEIENKLKDLANKVDMNLAELDLYLWYMETGKILK